MADNAWAFDAEIIQEHFGLKAEELAAIRMLAVKARQGLPAFLAAYEQAMLDQLNNPELRVSSPSVQALSVFQRAYWANFFRGVIDANYVQSRCHLAELLIRHRLSLEHYMMMVSFCRRWWHTFLFEMRKPEEDLGMAFHKLFDIDQVIVASQYDRIMQHNYLQLKQEVNNLAHGHLEKRKGGRLKNEYTQALQTRLNAILQSIENIADGKYFAKLQQLCQTDSFAKQYNKAVQALSEQAEQQDIAEWLLKSQTGVLSELVGISALSTCGRRVCDVIAKILPADMSALYCLDAKQRFSAVAAYALSVDKLPSPIDFSEGTIGQCATSQQPSLVDNIQPGALSIKTSAGDMSIISLYTLPLVVNHKTVGVLEVGSSGLFTKTQVHLLDQLSQPLAQVLGQCLAQQNQQTEIEQLQTALEKALADVSELHFSNDSLLNQQVSFEERLQELQDSKSMLQKQAVRLEMAEQKEAEYLRNMIKQLVSPVDSLIELCNKLAENPETNLTLHQQEQIQLCQSIASELQLLLKRMK